MEKQQITENITRILENGNIFLTVNNKLYLLSSSQISFNRTLLFLVNDIITQSENIKSIFVDLKHDTNILFLSSQNDIIMQHIFNSLKE